MAVYSEERSEGHFDENFKKLTLQKKFKVFKDTLEFIGEMHCRNFVHRDIKPANIFLNKEEGGLKTYVGDFGFSREAGHIYDICGSPLYMPLDAFSTPKDYPKQHDAFSMGVLLFQILNNCNTDELDDRVADLSARHNVSFERFPDRSYFFPNEPIENTLEKLCYDLLSPSPDSRPTIPQAKERFEGLLKAGFLEDREGNR
jgi:serine/threonine protein kinase